MTTEAASSQSLWQCQLASGAPCAYVGLQDGHQVGHELDQVLPTVLQAAQAGFPHVLDFKPDAVPGCYGTTAIAAGARLTKVP